MALPLLLGPRHCQPSATNSFRRASSRQSRSLSAATDSMQSSAASTDATYHRVLGVEKGRVQVGKDDVGPGGDQVRRRTEAQASFGHAAQHTLYPRPLCVDFERVVNPAGNNFTQDNC